MKWVTLGRMALVASLLLLTSCDKGKPQAKPTPPPPEVTVVEIHEQSVPQTREMVGRLASTRIAQVRARVAGIILKRAYEEGTDVKKGQILFQIDPEPLQAALHAGKRQWPRLGPTRPTRH